MATAAFESRELLASCLRAALEDPDLVDAIADQAISEGLNAKSVAMGSVSVERLKDLLFLTSDEAQLFYNVCCAIVKEEDVTNGNIQDFISLKLAATASGHISLRLGSNNVGPVMDPDSLTAVSGLVAAPMSGRMLETSAPEGPMVDRRVYRASSEDPIRGPVAVGLATSPSGRLSLRLHFEGNSSALRTGSSTSGLLAAPVSGNIGQVSGLVGSALSTPKASLPQPDLASTVAPSSEADDQVPAEHVAAAEPLEPRALAEVGDLSAVIVVSRVSPLPSKKLLDVTPQSASGTFSLPLDSLTSEPAQEPDVPSYASPPSSKKLLAAGLPASGSLSVPLDSLTPEPTEEPEIPARYAPSPPPPEPSSPAAVSATPPRPKSALPKPPHLALRAESSSPAALLSTSPAPSSSPAKSTPSYLRATAAHAARTAKEDSPRSPSLPPVPEEAKPARRRSLFDRMASTLLAPTQAFVARITGRNEELEAKKQPVATRASVQLGALLGSPAGQRVTQPQPFSLSMSASRSKSCVLTTEELRLAEAREKAWKRNPVPKHVHEARPIVPVVHSEPKQPEAVFAPFRLASLERHNKMAEEQRKKAEEEARADAEARTFRARSFDARIAAGPISPRKPAVSPPTRGVAPVFASEARIAHYHEVVEPVKKAKEAEANKEKLEAERKAKELEEMSVEEYRKTLGFKARGMPDFSAPFKPDHTHARPVTAPSEFQLHTVKRLGAAPSPGSKQDADGSEGAFAASLRKSTSAAMGSGRGGAAAVGRSAVVRQSAAAAYGRPATAGGGAAVRGSVGTALHAAIRAAARDAARDLEGRGAAASPSGSCGSASKRRTTARSNAGSPAVAAN